MDMHNKKVKIPLLIIAVGIYYSEWNSTVKQLISVGCKFTASVISISWQFTSCHRARPWLVAWLVSSERLVKLSPPHATPATLRLSKTCTSPTRWGKIWQENRSKKTKRNNLSLPFNFPLNSGWTLFFWGIFLLQRRWDKDSSTERDEMPRLLLDWQSSWLYLCFCNVSNKNVLGEYK